jgi:hypothetical protein
MERERMLGAFSRLGDAKTFAAVKCVWGTHFTGDAKTFAAVKCVWGTPKLCVWGTQMRLGDAKTFAAVKCVESFFFNFFLLLCNFVMTHRVV